MNSKHTPGPWFIAANPHPKETHPLASEFVSNTHRYVATYPEIEDEFGECCAEIVAQTFDGPNQAGNAALLAAAPELLAALEMLLGRVISDQEALNSDYGPSGREIIEQARAAIRKAKGEA